ncbi:MAG: PfkB family carbohydrate kinase [Acidobacteriota bacterium]
MADRIVILGGASLDTLHFQGRTERSAGGAGLYTALAARRAGAQVTMIGPRPEPMPKRLAPVDELVDWHGPTVSPERMPGFEIAHLGGGRTELRGAFSGAESELGVDWLPAGLDADWFYCIPLTDAPRQLAMLRQLAGRGSKTACGTYSGAVAEAPDVVRQALATAEAFFCNASEAVGLFGELDAVRTVPGKLLFVTRGAEGVRVIQGDHATDVPAVMVEELDPTGAGDTFCGTVLARLAAGAHPVAAARHGVAAAAKMVTAVGPAALLSPTGPFETPATVMSSAATSSAATSSAATSSAATSSAGTSSAAKASRVRIDDAQVERVAAQLSELPEVAAFDFTGADFPEPGHPGALDFFFATVLQQFGFWATAKGRYEAPTVLPWGGRQLKGSDYLWAVAKRWLDDAPGDLTPEGQRDLNDAALASRLRAEDGRLLPAHGLRLQQARAYGRDLTTLGLQPADIVARANADPQPLRCLLEQLDHVGGYKEDPLRKKSILLALILRQRPEAFLNDSDEPVPPVVDYHIQRSCLRIGLVRVDSPELQERLIAREVLPPADEEEIRAVCYIAMERLQRASGRSMGAVDWFFFQNRRRCPEMTEPECRVCPLDPVCDHQRELFQPVCRTTFY